VQLFVCKHLHIATEINVSAVTLPPLYIVRCKTMPIES